MKKILLIPAVLICLAVAAVYIFIPNTIYISSYLPVHANPKGVYRKLIDEESWRAWWPQKAGNENQYHFNHNGFNYIPGEKKINTVDISVSGGNIISQTSLHLISVNSDSVTLAWEGKIASSYNPLKRLNACLTAAKIKKSMTVIMKQMQAFYSKTENVYDFDIKKAFIVDSTLIFTFENSAGYPGTAFIYNLIGQLKNYIQKYNTRQTGYPMLNVYTKDSIHYLTRVAIPVDKKLPPSGNISYKLMPAGTNILITEVKGGNKEINKAFQQVENYISDYQRVPPAIPFLSLVTDRLKETDSTKWITRIYYPVI